MTAPGVVLQCLDGRLVINQDQLDRLRADGYVMQSGDETVLTRQQVVDLTSRNPQDEVCDFCSARPVVWSFPARDHEQVPGVAMSMGGWAACAVCAALIKRGDREKLLGRSAKRLRRKAPEMSTREIARSLRQIQDTFWANREGPGAAV